MTPCHRCPHPAAWNHDGLALCGTHVVDALIRTGRPARRLPVPDLVDRLLAHGDDLAGEAAAEIRRLRDRVAALEAGQSGAPGAVATARRLDRVG